MKPVAILVSGVNGVGKTTVGHCISQLLDIRDRIGLGTAIKTLRATGHRSSDGLDQMNQYFQKDPYIDGVLEEAKAIGPVITYLITEYSKQGTDCIIEGVQLLPQFLPQEPSVFHIHLSIGDPETYRMQLDHPKTKRNRSVTDDQFRNLVRLDQDLISLLGPQEAHIIPNTGSIDDVANAAVRAIKQKLPHDYSTI